MTNWKDNFLNVLEDEIFVRYDSHLINYLVPSCARGLGELLEYGVITKAKVQKEGSDVYVDVYMLSRKELPKGWKLVGYWS